MVVGVLPTKSGSKFGIKFLSGNLVGKLLVSFLDRGEFFFGLGRGVKVRMVLFCKLEIGLFDFFLSGGGLDLKNVF